MDSSCEMTLKSLILRHRSVAVLIHRGHLDDARLLLTRSLEDINALAERLGQSQLAGESVIQVTLLQDVISPGSLTQTDVLRLSRMNSFCLRCTKTLSALCIPTSRANKRTALIIAASLTILLITTWSILAVLDSNKTEAVLKDLTFLAQIAHIGTIKTNKTLLEITETNCSECSCRGGMDLRNLPVGQHCQRNWVHALAAIWQAASGESPFDLRGGIILEKRLLRDPWGSPYALNENTNVLRSAGPDGVLDTHDDISVPIQKPTTIQ